MGNSQTIQVANGGNQSVFVMMGDTRDRVETISQAFRQAAQDADFNINHVTDTRGFTKIKPGYSLPFHSPTAKGGRVYITIFSQRNSGSETPGPLELICCAHPWLENQGIVISKDNQMQATEEGKIWIDTTGRDHKRQPTTLRPNRGRTNNDNS